MPVYGTGRIVASNIARNVAISVPVPVGIGSISWSESLFGQNSGTIEYQGLRDTGFPTVRSVLGAYQVLDKVSLAGAKFEVASVSYSDQRVHPHDSLKKVYSVSVSLRETKQSQKDKAKLLKKLGGSSFPLYIDEANLIQTAGSISVNEQGYNNAELTFGQDKENTENEKVPNGPRTLFTLKNSVSVTLEEGDIKAHEPPDNTEVLRDTTSNFDESGPKRILKKTTRVNGQLAKEQLYTYGFAYLMENISPDGDILYSESPEAFWQLIEYRETIYIYQKVGDVSLNVRITEPAGNAVLGFVVHPDYDQFASVSFAGGGNVSFRSNAEYLVAEITTGWKLLRLKKETDDRNSLDPEDPYYSLFRFYKIPFYAQKTYRLRNSRGLFGEKIQPPFRIEFADYRSLEDRIKSRVPKQNISESGKVAILYPEPNYVEPMFIEAEDYQSNSFVWAFDPEEEADPDAFIPGTNRQAPAPRLMSGEETYSRITRKLTSADRYTEYISEYSSQDPGFDNSAERYSFREVEGRPPEPQSRMREYESKEVANSRIQFNSAEILTRYFVTSRKDDLDELIEEGGSVSLPEAADLKEAVEMLENESRLSYLQSSQIEATHAWYRPFRLTAGLSFSKPISGGYRVTSVNHNLQYQGTNNLTGAPLITTSGTKVTAGLNKNDGIKVDKKQEVIPNEQQPNGLDPLVDVTVTSRPGDLSRFFPPLESRRNF